MITKTPKKKKSAKKTKKKAKKKATKKKDDDEKKDGVLTLAQRREKIRARYENPCVIYPSDVEPVRYATRFQRFNRLMGDGGSGALGGLKKGAIIEVYGWEDSGKTTWSIAAAADIQAAAPKGKKHVVMVNYEMPQDYKWWSIVGLNVDKDHFTQLRPKTLEEGMADMADLVESGEVCCVIIDSVYAASAKGSRKVMEHWRDPKKGGGTGGGIGVEARQWGAAWTATKGLFVEHEVVCIAVNQLRVKIDMGGAPMKGYGGPPTTTPRGHALKFYAWVRLELKGSALITEDKKLRKDVDGRRIRIKVIKNKTSDEQRGICYYDLIRGQGFDMTGELIELSLEAGVIKHTGGGHYTCGSNKIHGKSKLRAWVEAVPKRIEVLRRCVDQWLAKQEIDEISLEDDVEVPATE